MDPIVIGGVAGAIGSVVTALTTQFFMSRTKALELRHADLVDARQRRAEESLARQSQVRRSYVDLNSSARELLATLTDLLRAVEADEVRDDERNALEQARYDYRICYAEAQLSASDEVLTAASSVDKALTNLFGVVKRFDKGISRDGESFRGAEKKRQEIWGRLSTLRSLMREDLGVSGSPPGES
ncbi:hypothetical protein ACFW4K_18385 [Nocardiopsis alba]|uniref:hypothetical protein n=1 Tax=Nocardiopsis alba TaxID=53437 RepID=UPI0036710410